MPSMVSNPNGHCELSSLTTLVSRPTTPAALGSGGERLSEILDQHDVGLREFVLNVHERAPILRTGQSPTHVAIGIPNLGCFPSSEFQELHPAVGSLVKSQKVNAVPGHHPIWPLVACDLSYDFCLLSAVQ